MASDPWPWDVLGLAPGATGREVRRAYALRLKALDAEDVDAFQSLRRAYEAALRQANGEKAPEEVPPSDNAWASGEEQSGDTTSGSDPLQPPPDWAASPVQQYDDGKREFRGEVLRRLGAGLFSLDIWTPIFASPLLDDASFAREVEFDIVTKLDRMRIPPTAGWMQLADRRFGWRSDGVGFQRRYPMAQHAHAFVVATAAVDPAPEVETFDSGSFWRHAAIGVGSLMLSALGLGHLLDTAIPFQVAICLLAAVLSTGAFLLAWSRGLRDLLWWAAGRVEGGEHLFHRLLLWLRGGNRPFGRWQGFLLGLTGVFWVGIMGTMAEFEAQPQPKIGDAEIRVAVLEQLGKLRMFTDGMVTYFGAEIELAQPRLALGGAVGDPDFVLFCPRRPELDWEGNCALRFGLPMTVARAVELDPGHPAENVYVDVLQDPILIESASFPDRKPIAYLWNRHGESDRYAKSASDLGGFPSMDLFPFEAFTVSSSIAQSAATWLDRGWPGQFEQTLYGQCMSEVVTTDGTYPEGAFHSCRVEAWDIRGYRQLDCGPGADPGTCVRQLLSQDEARRAEAMALRLDLSAPQIVVMRSLLRRMATPGRHPALPPDPEILAMRDQVLSDYALLLDRPEARDQRRNVTAIRAALGRQPQLAEVYRSRKSVRAATWVGLLESLERLGFDVTEARSRP